MEYQELAEYYDMFYKNKSYEKETLFLLSILENRKKILDAGCGTGNHMRCLENFGLDVDGIELNKEMLKIAKEKVKGNLYIGNILTYKTNIKYDAVISMFAVFNHLKNKDEFLMAIKNLLLLLNDNGILIIDLHNNHKSGIKTDVVCQNQRIMKWKYDEKTRVEHTNITYIINNHEYQTSHDFIIYDISYLNKELSSLSLDYQMYENYTFRKANNDSKNIQIVITKLTSR